MYHLNVHSLANNVEELEIILNQKHFKIVCLLEHWLNNITAKNSIISKNK